MPHPLHRDAVHEMGGGAREMVLDMVLRFWCRNGGSRIHKLTSFTLGHPTRKRGIPFNRVTK
jgi:hypothetical protein